MHSKMEILNERQRYYTLWKESNIIYEEWAKSHGLSANSLLILQSLYDGACTQKAISQRWCIPKQTINTILKDLEARGYLELTAMEQDRRNKQISLTHEGKQFVDTIITQILKKELYVIQQMGLGRMKSMNDDLELFIRLFREGEANKNEQ